MKTMKAILPILLLATIFTACKQATLKKTAGGMPYQLFSGKDTQSIKAGDYIKFSFTQKINDSVYFTNVGKPPIYTPVSPNPNPYDLSELWTKLKLGDSVVSTQLMDTFMKKNPQLAEQFKKGDRIINQVKILGIFTSDSAYRTDEEKEKKKYQEQEVAFLENYLKEKNITATKTPSGAFVQVINPGSGVAIDSGKYVSLKYTGTTIAGIKFDSNTDTSFRHTEPLSFTVGVGQMIKGFEEGVMFLKKGGIGKVYIPSMLGYGPNPQPGSKVKPYDHLIFDAEVLEVQDKAPAVPPMPPGQGGNQQPR